MPAALDDGAAAPSAWHVLGLVAALALVVTLSEEVGQYVDYGIEVLKFPAALGGIFIGALVLAPEALASLRAALANHLQRSVNVCLGAALAAISLTLPAVLLTTRFTGRPIELGLGSLDTLLLALTLAVSLITFATGRTNVLQGAVHLLLFATYLFLIVVP
jgi:Ca2+:H+ antiporter